MGWTAVSEIMSISRHRMGTDGAGVTTLVGFYGCPLNCKYCINKACRDDLAVRCTYTPDELLETLSIDEPYFLMTGGGIAFGGGEPLIQAEFVHEVCAKMPDEWKRTIETSLYANWENIEILLSDIDLWYVDIKEFDSDIYKSYTGHGNGNVLKNLYKLIDTIGEERVYIRYPIIPEYNDDNIRQSGIIKLKENISENIQIEKFEYIKCSGISWAEK